MMGLVEELRELDAAFSVSGTCAEAADEIESLRRTVAEQKEAIEQYSDVCERYKELYYKADKELAEQSALIECLHQALRCGWTVGARDFDAKQLADEALAAYEQYRNGGK